MIRENCPVIGFLIKILSENHGYNIKYTYNIKLILTQLYPELCEYRKTMKLEDEMNFMIEGSYMQAGLFLLLLLHVMRRRNSPGISTNCWLALITNTRLPGESQHISLFSL